MTVEDSGSWSEFRVPVSVLLPGTCVFLDVLERTKTVVFVSLICTVTEDSHYLVPPSAPSKPVATGLTQATEHNQTHW